MARAVSRIVVGALACAVAVFAGAAEPLFPSPLHITRQVHDPLSNTTVVLDEYGYGNRLVSVRGAKTSIADYERGELTEIDRDTATYSITRFDAIAKATQAIGAVANENAQATTALARPRALRSLGVKATAHGRNADFFESEVEAKELRQKVEVGVDRSATVSREALEVLLGAAYPGVRRAEHDLVLSAAAPQRSSVATNANESRTSLYALPVEQSTTIELDGQSLSFRTSVVRVGSEAPPADAVAIPAGARLVTSRLVAVQNELELFNRPASSVPDVH
ncbi:MAG TPA: hypothetical protein VHW00_25280 [Thermoanaerobaculia bacterium]|nr:hypothetical protein [Thermoanaerobaculia bacterium]